MQTATIRNFPEHRYKLGKMEKGIGLADFTSILNTIDALGIAQNHYVEKYGADKIKSALACFYWSGFRKTEVLGGHAKRYLLPPCKRHLQTIERKSNAVPGILKEDIEIKGEWIFITAEPRKKGSRDAPIELPLVFPYVNLIVEQWDKTTEGQKVWNITEWDMWHLMKLVDPRQYVHFFRFNRITELCCNPEISLGEICSWSGLSPLTINSYLERSGRLIHSAAVKMKRQYVR